MNENAYFLVVEDEPDGAAVISRILKYHQIKYCVARNAEDALNYLQHESPTAMLVDLCLPGEMDGWQLLHHVRSNAAFSHIPMIAITAFHSSSVALEAITAGFNAYFAKPIEATSFVREIERVINE